MIHLYKNGIIIHRGFHELKRIYSFGDTRGLGPKKHPWGPKATFCPSQAKNGFKPCSLQLKNTK